LSRTARCFVTWYPRRYKSFKSLLFRKGTYLVVLANTGIDTNVCHLQANVSCLLSLMSKHTVGPKSIFSAKSIFRDFQCKFKVLNIWLDNPIFLFCFLKMLFKSCCFSGTFSVMAIAPATDNYFGKLFSYSKRAVQLVAELQVSYGGLGNFFFLIELNLKNKRFIRGL
jgi:hypothetical protein